jgi:hypothetical protein
MPLEPDDLQISPEQEKLNHQLEALQRYVDGLQQQRDQANSADQSSPAPESRPSRRWLLFTGLLVVLALVGGVFVGAVAWSDDRSAGAAAGATNGSPVRQQAPGASSGGQGSNPTTAAPVASPACKTAVDRANTMLATAVQLHRELAEYSRIMTDPASRELSGRELVDKSAPALRAGTSESARFTQALTDYRQVVDQCRLQAG